MLILMTALAAQAKESDWIKLDVSDGKELYINPELIDVVDENAGIIELWIKFITVQKTAKSNVGDNARILFSIKCKTKEYAFKQITEFDKSGHVKSTNKLTILDYAKTIPDTYMYEISKAACLISS